MKPARSRRTSSAATLLVLTAVASFAACSSDDDDPAAPTPPSAAEALKSACPGLAGATVPASAIGLPSGAATVDSAIVVAAVDQAVSGNTVTPATPDHCRVLGSIAPVDAQAQRIHFQLNLPIAWNQKAVQYGGGGYNGTLVTGLAPLRDAAPGDLLPLMRGYATLGTDSGHQAASYAPDRIAEFGLNDEMLENYGFASYKKARDVAVSLIRSYYGDVPQRLYYFGGSEGGREGLTMAQRFPSDYDGIVSVVPVVQLSMLFQSYLPRQLPQMNGGWLSPAKVSAFARFVSDACDELDGLADGVVNNYLACPGRIDLQALRCPDGADIGDQCLSDPQLDTLRAVHAPFTLQFPMANGLMSYPQSLFGNETTPDTVNATMTRWVTGTAPPTLPIDTGTAAQQWLYGVNFVRFFVARDAAFDVRQYDPANFRTRLEQVSALIDSSNPDLSAFFARGGKLILRENMGDLAQSPLAGINYFQSVVDRLGQQVVDGSARLYISPASNHSGPAASVTDGTLVPTAVDLLDPLDTWVSSGQPPAETLVQTRKATVPPFAIEASRPMCRYPGYPHYVGGDVRVSASYECRASAP